MRRRMIALRIPPGVARHRRARGTELHASCTLAECRDPTVDAPNFIDVNAPALALDFAFVRDLAARFDVERRLPQHHRHASIRQILLGDDLRSDIERIVADELGIMRLVQPAARPSPLASRYPRSSAQNIPR